MNGGDAAKLGRVLAASDRAGGGPEGWCGLCDRDLDADDAGGIVAVEMHAESEDPDAWLCRSCYEYVVGEMGITPTRVFKAGPRRTVVLPIGPDGDHESVMHWD